MDANLSTQLLAWTNTITIPALLLAAWKISRWIAKKEQQAQSVTTAVLSELNIIKTNHLPHMQETLNEIKAGQDEAAKQATENTREIVAAVRASQDAIVQAIISTKAN